MSKRKSGFIKIVCKSKLDSVAFIFPDLAEALKFIEHASTIYVSYEIHFEKKGK